MPTILIVALALIKSKNRTQYIDLSLSGQGMTFSSMTIIGPGSSKNMQLFQPAVDNSDIAEFVIVAAF